MPRNDSSPDDRERLQHMLAAARDAIAFSSGRARGELESDHMLLRALVNCVQVIGEAAARTSDAGRLLAPNLPWAKMVGMRHILVHAYFNIDTEAVWRVVQQDLPELVIELEKAITA